MSFWKRNKEKAIVEETTNQFAPTKKESNEIYAAIAMAIFSSTEYHDEEVGVLTIKRADNFYSPWSSKIQTLRELPLRK